MGTSMEGGQKFINVPGHMIKMVSVSIYGKTYFKNLLRDHRPIYSMANRSLYPCHPQLFSNYVYFTGYRNTAYHVVTQLPINGTILETWYEALVTWAYHSLHK